MRTDHTTLEVRRARTSDVPEIKRLIDVYAGRILLEKNLVTLYEAVQEFWVVCRSYDTGVAEFLDLSYVEPNTLGNTRMLLTL